MPQARLLRVCHGAREPGELHIDWALTTGLTPALRQRIKVIRALGFELNIRPTPAPH